jgi:hypothetical protein
MLAQVTEVAPFSHSRTQSRLRTLSNPGVILTGAVLQAKGRISDQTKSSTRASLKSPNPYNAPRRRPTVSPGEEFVQKNDLAAEGTDAFRE